MALPGHSETTLYQPLSSLQASFGQSGLKPPALCPPVSLRARFAVAWRPVLTRCRGQSGLFLARPEPQHKEGGGPSLSRKLSYFVLDSKGCCLAFCELFDLGWTQECVTLTNMWQPESTTWLYLKAGPRKLKSPKSGLNQKDDGCKHNESITRDTLDSLKPPLSLWLSISPLPALSIKSLMPGSDIELATSHRMPGKKQNEVATGPKHICPV